MTTTSAVGVKPPVPPFTHESAALKARLAEDAWNSRDPQRVAEGYSIDSVWRNRSTFVTGRAQIVEFLGDKWNRELEYRLIKELWAHSDNRIAVRFAYEYHDDSGQWFRAYGNENWLYNEHGLMTHRHASINDLRIDQSQRKFFWDTNAPRPQDHPGLSDLGL
ncbi:nuclear transport factor 2 family protein [Mycolicibacterium neoaurum]|uniref:nuclear transport factor 2 family protein n=1 Tax=Mycolicibacterium neoaurum TaxID=1795 RepID=UPI001BCF6E06|nr:nuclear transport factor 2 family protein [Mycolicibacterium neoaurum]QVI27136.1 nuclear transport factor 2 family protein [Mycolicibacterium neoaurum]